ncbi:hypothetical protein [Alkalinema sp. FACHB-956]|uniref:hypothetical protein n=1 Tax=Alkalinema sp. FACHB-956 TaxID=2692768 RepID=UPI0016883DD9|nr:hypothetical protein [Alkalinema sp. FACHB-956]MBD2326544.1 hypothetical protein [Alkalinema sp. FACHB-956]
MRHSRAAGQIVSAETAYSPSVPISLYREVSSELQSTKAAMESLKHQNRQLLQQNQQLRQEIERLVKLAMYTQQAVSHLPSLADDPIENAIESASQTQFMASTIAGSTLTDPWSSQTPAASQTPVATMAAKPSKVSQGSGARSAKPIKSATPRKLPAKAWVMEQEATPRWGVGDSSDAAGGPLALSGWKLAIVIPLIVLTAFGAGFMLVRPLLSSK